LLSQAVPGISAVVLPMDAYYRDLAHVDAADRALSNFDEPAAIEVSLLVSHLQALVRGEGVSRPVYDYVNHTRSHLTELVDPVQLVIVEGVLALHWEDVRLLSDLRVFIDVPGDVCLQRRLERDARERGRTEASVREQYAATVWPMYQRYGEPSKAHADLIADGCCPAEEIASAIADYLPTV